MIKILIIHVVIDFNGNHHKKIEFQEIYGLIMDFWNDNTMIVT